MQGAKGLFVMQTAEFEKMRALGGAHWWFLGRKHLLRALLRSSIESDRVPPLILDAGCGTGVAEDALSDLGSVVGIDIAPKALAGRSPTCPESLCVASVNAAPFPDETFDLVVALDILEHIEDDGSVLRELYRICRAGGRLMITVPAYQWLHSAHDEALGHCRRYSARRIRRLLRDAGFRLGKLSYCVTAPFPTAVAFRLLRRLLGSREGSDLFEVPRALNSILTVIMRVEAAFLRRMNLPFGLSIVAIGEKGLAAFG